MRLLIENEEGLKLDHFLQIKVIPFITTLFIGSIEECHCKKWQLYFNTNEKLGWKQYKNKTVVPSVREILVAGIQSLEYHKFPDRYVVQLNPNEICPKTNAKLVSICSLINYGNTEMIPYPIFTEVFNFVKRMLPYLLEEYMEEGNGSQLL